MFMKSNLFISLFALTCFSYSSLFMICQKNGIFLRLAVFATNSLGRTWKRTKKAENNIDAVCNILYNKPWPRHILWSDAKPIQIIAATDPLRAQSFTNDLQDSVDTEVGVMIKNKCRNTEHKKAELWFQPGLKQQWLMMCGSWEGHYAMTNIFICVFRWKWHQKVSQYQICFPHNSICVAQYRYYQIFT